VRAADVSGGRASSRVPVGRRPLLQTGVKMPPDGYAMYAGPVRRHLHRRARRTARARNRHAENHRWHALGLDLYVNSAVKLLGERLCR